MLSLGEKLLLLSLHEEKGFISSGSSYIGYGLTGAVLIQLLLSDKIRIDNKRLVVINSSLTGDSILDEVISILSTMGKDRTVQYWITHVNHKMRHLWQRAGDRMEDKGIVRRNVVRVMGFFTAIRYPVINPVVRNELIEQLRSAVLTEDDPEQEMVALISLVTACSFLRVFFAKDERKTAVRNARRLMKDHPVGKAVSDTIAGIQAAVVVSPGSGI